MKMPHNMKMPDNEKIQKYIYFYFKSAVLRKTKNNGQCGGRTHDIRAISTTL